MKHTPELSQADRLRIADRYPSPQSMRGPAIVGTLLIGALTAWGIWTSVERSRPPVEAQLYGYTVVSDTQVDVELDVHRRDPAKPATCTVLAQAPSGETVGELPVVIAPGDQQDQRVKASVRTYLRAHTALLQQCTSD